MAIEPVINIFKSGDRRLTKAKLTKLQAGQINALWQDAIQVFVRATIKEMMGHVDTGMSVASLIAVAEAADVGPQKTEGLVKARLIGQGEQEVQNALQLIKRSRRKGFTDIDGSYSSEGERSAQVGEKLGQNAYLIEYVDSTSGRAFFQFTIVVYQHDKHMRESIDRGREAMLAYINANFSEYVNPLKVLREVLNI